VRIAVLTNEYEPDIVGGLGTVSTRLAEHMENLGHQLIVITKGPNHRIEDSTRAGVRVIRFPRESQYYGKRTQLFYATPILQYLDERVESLELIHIHSLQSDQLLTALKKRYNAATVYTCHSMIALEGVHTTARRRMEARQIAVMHEVDAVVAPSRWQKRMIHHVYKQLSTPVRVIPNGVRIYNTLVATPKRARLLYAGRVIRSKGVEELLRALRIVRKTRHQLGLDIYGTGSPMYMKRLRRLSHLLQLDDAVQMLGKCDQHTLQMRMAEYQAVIVPSRTESFGLVALESMAAGTPLIATRVTGMRDFVDRKVATIIPRRTPKGISMAILTALEGAKETERRRQRARTRAKTYRWSNIAQRYQGLFFELVDKKSKGEHGGSI